MKNKFKKGTTALAIIIAGSVFYGSTPAHAGLEVDDLGINIRFRERREAPQPPREPPHKRRGPREFEARRPGGPGDFRRPGGPDRRRGFDAPPPPPPPPPHVRGRRG